MKNSDLYNLIKDFRDEEINGFDKYLCSPYFVSGTSLNKVFKEIIRNKNLFLNSEYEKLNDKLCKKLKYSKLTLNKQLSYLSKEIMRFLKIKSIEQDEEFAIVKLNEYLFRKKDYTTLKQSLKKANSVFSSLKNFNEKTYLHYFMHDVISFNYQILDTSIKTKNNKFNSTKKLSKILIDITLYSYIEITSTFVDFMLLDLFKHFQIDKEYLSKLSDFIINFDRLNIYKEYSTEKTFYDIYHNMFLTYYDKKNNKNFLKYKELVQQNIKLLSPSLINFHYQALYNFCAYKERLGQDKEYYYREELFLLLDYFNNNYYKVDGVEFVIKSDYQNFINRAYSIKDLELLKSFIEKVSSKLKPIDYNNMVNYGYAFYYLATKEYRKSLKCINSINDTDIYIKFNIRNIELRLYYELGKIETLTDSIHNYRSIILNSKDLTTSDKDGLLKLLKYLNILISINNKTDLQKQVQESEYYRRLIEKEPQFALKKWILEKFNNLLSDINARKQPKAKIYKI